MYTLERHFAQSSAATAPEVRSTEPFAATVPQPFTAPKVTSTPAVRRYCTEGAFHPPAHNTGGVLCSVQKTSVSIPESASEVRSSLTSPRSKDKEKPTLFHMAMSEVGIKLNQEYGFQRLKKGLLEMQSASFQEFEGSNSENCPILRKNVKGKK
ncbi:hypothetical protein AVEN_39715-1 [Araneus ventricosus]|uniref:Uncharacterized protein n=1 Tax=Araneus ventricosus TaxID=182803 RepID=A0A4Y2LXC3_ARAVE|nr:hypothetical protein AVEN_39715-1 [Araneus ventricosus]